MTAMRDLLHRLALSGGVAMLVALALGQPSPLATATAFAASVLLVASGLVVGSAAVQPLAHGEIAIGSRARAHRESLGHQAEPSHPLTAGRPLARAPGAVISAA